MSDSGDSGLDVIFDDSCAYKEICIDNAMEKYYMKLVSNESRLVLETTFPLNCTTNVIVGSSPARDFTPVIKLTSDGDSIEKEGSSGKGNVVIPIEDWDLIIDYFIKSMKFLNDDDIQLLKTQTIFDLTLSQQIFQDRRCIKIESRAMRGDASQCLYLMADVVLALINLTPILNSHLCRIKHLGLHEAYNKILRMLPKMTSTDSVIERFKMLSSLLEPSVETVMLEVVRFHTSKLYNDYECIKI